MTMRQLALHLASFPSWAVETLEKESIDIAPPGGAPYQPPVVNSRDEILEMFQRDSVKAKGALGRATDVDLQKKWTLLRGGKTIFSMPRIEVLRRMVMNHMIHHRAQIGVYLRLNDLPVPAIYGPSADEGRFL